MLNCSGGWKLIETDIGRGRLAVNRRARYDTATHGSPRPRAPDLGGGSRPRPDEDGGDRARRRRRGARAPSTARDRRDHRRGDGPRGGGRSEEHTSELQSRFDLVCRLLLEKKKMRL